MKIKTFGPVDERSRAQLERCMAFADAELGVLCADRHLDYSQPIGSAAAAARLAGRMTRRVRSAR